jgi:hypothetical protein
MVGVAIPHRECIVCGRIIGVMAAVEVPEFDVLLIHGFRPHAAYSGPIGNSIRIDTARGTITKYDDEGNVVDFSDLIDVIKDCPRAPLKAVRATRRRSKSN